MENPTDSFAAFMASFEEARIGSLSAMTKLEEPLIKIRGLTILMSRYMIYLSSGKETACEADVEAVQILADSVIHELDEKYAAASQSVRKFTFVHPPETEESAVR